MKKLSSKLLLLLVNVMFIVVLTGCMNNQKNNNSGSTGQASQDDQIIEVNKQLNEIKNSNEYLSKDIDTQTDMMMDAISKQADAGNIKSGSIICDKEKHIITFEYNSGAMGCDIVGGFDDETDSAAVSADNIRNDEVFASNGVGRTADAIILNAMTDRKEVLSKCRDLATEWSSSGINTKLDDTVTLDDLTSLEGYEFMYFKMHGCYCNYSLAGKNAKVPCIFLEQKVSSDTNRKYDNDINKNKRVGITTSNRYFITPDFFKAHYNSGDLSGSILFLGCCQLMGKDGNIVEDWTRVFDDISVASFVAFHNSNYTYYNLDLVNTFMDNLVLGKTTRESLDIAIAEYGNTDEDWHIKTYGNRDEKHIPAYPLLRGGEDAVLLWEGSENTCNSFYSFLRSGYESADEYKNGLPVLYSLGGDNKKHPESGQIWKDYIINDFDSDGEDEMILRVSFYTVDPSNESGNIFYYYELQNDQVIQDSYSFTAEPYSYDPEMTLFMNNRVIYDEHEEEYVAMYIFSADLRKKLGLNDGEYILYAADRESESETISRLICSTFDVRKKDIISMDEYEKESDMIMSGDFLDVVICPATEEGIENSK